MLTQQLILLNDEQIYTSWVQSSFNQKLLEKSSYVSLLFSFAGFINICSHLEPSCTHQGGFYDPYALSLDIQLGFFFSPCLFTRYLFVNSQSVFKSIEMCVFTLSLNADRLVKMTQDYHNLDKISVNAHLVHFNLSVCLIFFQ